MCIRDRSYRVVKSRFMGVLHQYSTYIDHVLTDIGGVMRSENDTTRFYVPVSKSYMIKVMQFLDQHVLVPFEWLYRDSLATRVDVDARRLAKDLYESTITRLVQKSINICLLYTSGRSFSLKGNCSIFINDIIIKLFLIV